MSAAQLQAATDTAMAELGCDMRAPRGSSRAGAGGNWCATHREGEWREAGVVGCRRAFYAAQGLCGHALCMAEDQGCLLDQD